MGRKKYFVMITNDVSTAILELAFLSSIQTLDKIKELDLPLDCQKLLATQFKAIQLVCDVETLNPPSKYNINTDGSINWGDDYDGQNDIPVHILDTTSSLALALHNLAGSLPQLGSYELTVYCEGPLFNMDAMSHLDVFSALLRLSIWCNGNVYHVPSESYPQLGVKWDRVIRIENIPINGEICLWKGNFILKPGFWMTQFKICYHIDNVNTVKLPYVFDAEPNLLYRVSHRLEVLQECDATKVPSYMIYPTNLKLKPFTPKIEGENKFIQHTRKNYHIAVVARFQYYLIDKAIDKDKMTLDNWNTALVADTYRRGLIDDYPDSETASYMNVLICWNMDIEDELSCYIFRNPGEMNQIFLDKVLEKSHIPLPTDIQMAKNLFKNIPSFNPSYYNLVKDVEDTRVILSDDELPLEQKANRKFMLRLQRLKVKENEYLTGKVEAESPAQDTDPCDWVERKFLASLAKNDEPVTKMTKTCQSNLSLDVTKYFDSKGDSKQNPILNINKEDVVMPSKYNQEQIKLATMPWPQPKDQHFHDIYYNDDKSEQTENKSMQLRNQLKYDETSSKDFKETYLAKEKNPRKISPKSRKKKTPKKSKLVSPRKRQTVGKKTKGEFAKETMQGTEEKTGNVEIATTTFTCKSSEETATSNRTKLLDNAKVPTPSKKTPTKKINKSPIKKINKTPTEKINKTPTEKINKTPTKKANGLLDKETIPNSQETIQSWHKIELNKHSSPIKKTPRTKQAQKKIMDVKVTNVSQAKKLQLKLKPKPNTKAKLQQIQKSDLENKTIMKLREAVVSAFESRGVKMSDPLFKTCGKRLFNICKEYAIDLEGKPGASAKLKLIAEANVDQVILFEKNLNNL